MISLGNQQFLSMNEISLAEHLNFYSKYNRVRDKQNISSLYFLIDNTEEYIEHLENMTFTLNLCKEESKFEDIKPKEVKYGLKTKNSNILQEFDRDQREQEQQKKRNELSQKLKKLQKLQRQFYDQLDKSEKNYKVKKELRDQQRKERQKYRKQLINVIEQQQQGSQQSKVSKYSQEPKYSDNAKSNQEQINQIHDFQDYYRESPDFQIQDFSQKVPLKQYKKKFKEIIRLQKEEKYVQSVDQQQEGKSSIVIERLHIQLKKKQSQEKPYQQLFEQNTANNHVEVEKLPVKEHKNYYEIELTHSQSQNIIRKYESTKEDEDKEKERQKERQKEREMEKERQQQKDSPISFIKQQKEYIQQSPYKVLISQPTSEIPEFNEKEEEEEEQEQMQAKVVNCSDREFQQQEKEDNMGHDIVETPITHLQQICNNMFYLEDPSDIIEQIDDKVSIDRLIDDQKLKKKNYSSDINPTIFRSQANNRKTFDNQQEVQSIAESLDFHPFEYPNMEHLENIRQIIHQQQNPILSIFKQNKIDKEISSIENSPVNDKKLSFKKLMAANRSNLVPRLAISTILNEHINEALGDYKSNNIIPFLIPMRIQEAPKEVPQIVIKQSSIQPSKPVKMNFKKAIVQNKKLNSSRDISFIKDPAKAQQNKKLFMNFFDSN